MVDSRDEQRPPQQGALFDDPTPAPDDQIGYRGPTACSAAGITYRQLDYWARTELVVPSVRSATGSGTQRLYSFKDILVLKVVKRLLDTGVSLHNIRLSRRCPATARGVDDLARITLLSDGTTVYECTSSEEVVDLLRGGQGVFGIAVSGALRELVGSLAHLPGERAVTTARSASFGPVLASAADELTRRRERRTCHRLTADLRRCLTTPDGGVADDTPLKSRLGPGIAGTVVVGCLTRAGEHRTVI